MSEPTGDETPAETERPSPSTGSVSGDLSILLQGLQVYARDADRADLAQRLDPWVGRLKKPRVRVVVVGPFKQGKSTLVNTLVGKPVCPVDDIYMTAIPTTIEFGPEPTATLIADIPGENKTGSFPIDPARLREHVMDLAPSLGSLDGARVEVTLPADVLKDGLVLVDTPGVGGIVTRHVVTTLAQLPTADALLVLSDASQEFTSPELTFLRQAATVCPNVLCVLSKIDLAPHWRDVAAANERHLESAGIEATLFPISATLYTMAIASGDSALAEESGVPGLVERLQHDLTDRAVVSLRQAAADNAAAVSEHLTLALQSELETLVRPGEAAKFMKTLEDAQAAAADLNKRASRWQQLLNDAFTDLLADAEYDIRDRIRAVGRDAEQLIDESDPADTWETMSQWLADAFADVIAESFVWADQRCEHIATTVAESFRLDGHIELPHFPNLSTDDVLAPVAGLDVIRTERMTTPQKLVGAMRGSYSGILMAGIVTTLAGMALVNPISILAGAVLGGFSLRQESVNRLERRRNEARNAIRRAVDETSFHVVKEAKSRLIDVRRLMRREFESTAEEFRNSLQQSLEAAKRGANTSVANRDARTKKVTERLTHVSQFVAKAQQLAAESES